MAKLDHHRPCPREVMVNLGAESELVQGIALINACTNLGLLNNQERTRAIGRLLKGSARLIVAFLWRVRRETGRRHSWLP